MTAQATLDLIIDADYRAARTLRAFGGDLEKVGKQSGTANRALESTRKMMAGGLNVAANVAKVGIAGVGVALGAGVFAASKFIAAGADVQESMGKFNVVFADAEGTVDNVTSQLDAFAKASGRNKFALREMAGGLGDILKPLGFSVADAGDLSVTLSKLAVDLGSFNNMAPEEAFERIRGTLIGSHENALAFGVVINENTLKAELARMGAEDYTGAMLEQAKVQARINLLIAGTSDAQGDAIRTSGSWTNQMLRLRSILEETSAELGLKLIPVLSPFLEMLGDLAAKWAPQAAVALENLIGSMDVEALKASLDTFIEGLTVGEINLGKLSIDLPEKKVAYGDVFSFGTSDDTGEIMVKIGGLTIDKEGGHPKIAYGDVFSFELTDDNEVLINGVSFGTFVKLGYASLFDIPFITPGTIGLGMTWGTIAALTWADLMGITVGDDGSIGVDFQWSNWESIAQLTLAKLFGATVLDDDGNVVAGFSWGTVALLGLAQLFGVDVLDDDGNVVVDLKWGTIAKLAWLNLFGIDVVGALGDDKNIIVDFSWGTVAKLTWTKLFPGSVNEDGEITLSIGDIVFVKEGEGTLAASIVASLLGGGIFALTQGGKLVMNIVPKFGGTGQGDGEGEGGIGATIGSAIASKMMAAATGMGLKVYASIIDAGGLLTGALSLTFSDVTDYLGTWSWPEYLTFEWPEYLTWKWPTYPKWKWPEIKTPAWVDKLLAVFGGGGSAPAEEEDDELPANARGTRHWRGGRTIVGEEGPEIVDLPRGSRIYPNSVSSQMLAASAGRNVTINVQATINNKMDSYELAYTLADVLQRA